MNSNLTLTGLTFTVIALETSLFAEKIAIISGSVYSFAVAMTFFLLSYIVLHLKIREAFDYFSNAFTNTGLWALIIGLVALSEALEGLNQVSWLLRIVLAIFGVYILVDLFFSWRAAA